MPITLDLADKAVLVRLGSFFDIMTLGLEVGL